MPGGLDGGERYVGMMAGGREIAPGLRQRASVAQQKPPGHRATDLVGAPGEVLQPGRDSREVTTGEAHVDVPTVRWHLGCGAIPIPADLEQAARQLRALPDPVGTAAYELAGSEGRDERIRFAATLGNSDRLPAAFRGRLQVADVHLGLREPAQHLRTDAGGLPPEARQCLSAHLAKGQIPAEKRQALHHEHGLGDETASP